jgi:hypothetical protein
MSGVGMTSVDNTQEKDMLRILPDTASAGAALALAAKASMQELDALFEAASAAFNLNKMDLIIMAIKFKNGGI